MFLLFEGSDGSDLGSSSDGDIEAMKKPEAAEQGLDVNNMEDDELLDALQHGGKPSSASTSLFHGCHALFAGCSPRGGGGVV